MKQDPYNDRLGQGNFCNALWEDSQGFFCSTRAAEGYANQSYCPFTEHDCEVNTNGVIYCQSYCGLCQDFEPSIELRAKLLGGDPEKMRAELMREEDTTKKHKFLDI